MAERKELNCTTARTLRNTLEIPRKLSSAIATYRRRKGNFKHIDELWKVSGMTRKIHEQICQHYFVSGQRPTMMGEPEPYVCTSLQRTVDTDSESYANHRIRSKRSSKVVVGMPVVQEYKADYINPAVGPKQHERRCNGEEGPHISAFDSDTLNMSVVPISVRESPSGGKLCIVYKRTPKRSSEPSPILNGEITDEPSLQLWSTKQASPQRPRGILRSPTPSPTKQQNIQHKLKSKSHLERSRSSSERNDGNEHSPTKSFITARNKTPSPKKKSPPHGVAANQEEIRVEQFYSEHIERVCEPSTSMPFGHSVESSEKVSQWINSNVDFMKIPRPVGSFWQTITPTPFSTQPLISGREIDEERVSRKTATPKSKLATPKGKSATPKSKLSDRPGTYTIHQTGTFRRQIPNPSSTSPLPTQQQFTSFTKDKGTLNGLADKNGRHIPRTTRETIVRRTKHHRSERMEKRFKPAYQSQDSEAEHSSLQCVLI